VVVGLVIITTDDLKVFKILFNSISGNIKILTWMLMCAADSNISRRLTLRASAAKIVRSQSLGGSLIMLAIALGLGKESMIRNIEFWQVVAT
jgi:hypothetical protein